MRGERLGGVDGAERVGAAVGSGCEERNEWRRRAGVSRIRWPYADGQAVGIGVVPPDSERAIEWIRVALCRRPGRQHR